MNEDDENNKAEKTVRSLRLGFVTLEGDLDSSERRSERQPAGKDKKVRHYRKRREALDQLGFDELLASFRRTAVDHQKDFPAHQWAEYGNGIKDLYLTSYWEYTSYSLMSRATKSHILRQGHPGNQALTEIFQFLLMASGSGSEPTAPSIS